MGGWGDKGKGGRPNHRPLKGGEGLTCGTVREPILASGLGSTPVLPTQLSVEFQILGALWDLGVCCRSGLPGEKEEAATQGQHICPGPAAEPGPRLGSVGRCPEGFRPHPRAAAEAAGKPSTGEVEPAQGDLTAGGEGGGNAGPSPSPSSNKCPGGGRQG